MSGKGAAAAGDARSAEISAALADIEERVLQAEGSAAIKSPSVLQGWILELKEIEEEIRQDEKMTTFKMNVRHLLFRTHNLLAGVSKDQAQSLAGRGNLVSRLS